MKSYYHCSTCGLVIGGNHKPVKEYPRTHMVYAVMYICEVCRNKGITFDTPIQQRIPKEWDDNVSEQQTEKTEKNNKKKEIRETIGNYYDELSEAKENHVLTWVDGRPSFCEVNEKAVEKLSISDKQLTQ